MNTGFKIALISAAVALAGGTLIILTAIFGYAIIQDPHQTEAQNVITLESSAAYRVLTTTGLLLLVIGIPTALVGVIVGIVSANKRNKAKAPTPRPIQTFPPQPPQSPQTPQRPPPYQSMYKPKNTAAPPDQEKPSWLS